MTTVNALSVALFNAAPGGYSADMAKNPAAYAGAVGAVLEKDLSTDAAFVDHVLGNFGIASTNALFAEAKAAMMGLVTAQGRALATTSAINFLAGVPRTDKYAGVADAFFAKVNTATAFSTANPRELDVSKLIAAVTGVDTDVVATNAAFAAGAASRDSEVGALRVDVAKLQADLKASQDAAAAAATKAAADAAAAKTAADAAAAKAAADLKAAQDAATAAATKAAADLKAANDKIAVIDDTAFASESAAAAAAKADAEAAAATAAAAAKAEADAALAAKTAELATANATITALQNPAGGTFALTTGTDTVIAKGGNDSITATNLTFTANDVIVDASSTDNDTLTITAAASISATPIVAGIENIVINATTFTEPTLAVDNIRGGTITVNNTQTGGSSLATVTGLATGMTLATGSAITGQLTVTAVDNAAVTINTASTSVVATEATSGDASKNIATLTVNASGGSASTGVTVDTDTDGTVTIAASATGDLTVDAVAATTVVVTNTAGAVDASKNNLTAATAVTIIAKDEVTVTTAAATAVTVSAAGGVATGTTASSITDAGTTLTTINVSGNGSSAMFDITAAGNSKLSTVNISGSQDVVIKASGLNVTGLTDDKITIVDNSTAKSTLMFSADAGGAALNLTAAAVDNIQLSDDMSGDTLTIASGANVEIDADQTNLILTASAASAATNSVNLSILDENSTSTTLASHTVTKLTTSNIKTVNLAVSDTDEVVTGGVSGVVLATINVGATNNLVVSGPSDLNFTTVLTAASVNASAVTGKITMALAGKAEVKNVTTGSGADTITIADAPTSGAFTINTGAGIDTIMVNKSTAMTIDGGDGQDTVSFTDSLDFNGKAVSLTGVEVLDLDRDTAGANTIKFDSDALSGKALVVKSSTKSNTNPSVADDLVEITAVAPTVDLSGLVVDATSVSKFTINVTGLAAFNAVTVTGTNSVDEITADNAAKALTAFGGDGVDTITGSNAADYISGDAGNDILNGGAGADTILGGAGDDTITGGTGADTLTGGAGKDTFVIETAGHSSATSMDSITDFTTGASTFDSLNLNMTAGAGTTVASMDVSAATAETELGTLTASATAGIITLAGTDKANVNTLTEWIEVARLLADSTAVNNNGSVVYSVLAFEFSGDTYVYEYADGITTAANSVMNVVKLVGLTGVTGIAGTGAANVIDLA